MKYLHTMVRVNNLEQSLFFYCDVLGLVETDRYESEAGEFTLVYLAAPDDIAQANAERSPFQESPQCLIRYFSVKGPMRSVIVAKLLPF